MKGAASPRDRTWRIRSLLVETVSAMRSDLVKLVIMFVLTTAILAAAATGTAATAQHTYATDQFERDSGRDVLVISPVGGADIGVDAAACEQLNHQPAVIASGSDFGTVLRELDDYLGTRVAVVEATAGLLSVFSYDAHTRAVLETAPRTAVLGSDVADLLGLSPGAHLTLSNDGSSERFTIGETTGSLPRDPDANRSVLTLAQPHGDAQACYVELTPAGATLLSDGGLLALAPFGSAALSVRRLFDPADTTGSSPEHSMLNFLLYALGIVMVWELLRISRRSERALYTSFGTSRAQLALMSAVEFVAVIIMSLATSIVIATLHIARSGWYAEAIDYSVYAATIVSLLALVARVPLTFAGSNKDVLSDLKDR